MNAPLDMLSGIRRASQDCAMRGDRQAANELLDIAGAVADLLQYRHIVQQALANYAERCESAAAIPAITQRERGNRSSLVSCGKQARAALTALARVGGA